VSERPKDLSFVVPPLTGEWVLLLRRRLGLKQIEFGQALGLAKPGHAGPEVAGWEAGNAIPQKHHAKLLALAMETE